MSSEEFQDLPKLAEYLRAQDYTEAGLTGRYGVSRPPDDNQVHALLHHTQMPSPSSALVRLFLMGLVLPEKACHDILEDWFLDTCDSLNLIEREGGKIRATVVITPLDDCLFFSDAFHYLGSEEATDFILPASTHSANFLRKLMISEPVADTLDLCCGCGVHAIFASAFSDHVTATDISPRAVRYAEMNAALNSRSNIDFATGDLFAAVGNRSFDLIISNPPFVVAPDEEFVYRDNPMTLDNFCRHLIKDAPQYLKPGAHLQMLCEWVEINGQPWQERLGEWFADTGCDAWVLRSSALPPAGYATARLRDIQGPGIDVQKQYVSWVANFAKHDVTAVHPGHIVLRKRDGNNWVHARNLPRDISEPAGSAILSAIAACDDLQSLQSDEVLLGSRLQLSPDLQLLQSFQRDNTQWSVNKITLSLQGILPLEGEVDMPVMAFLNLFDGTRTVAENLEKFGNQTNAQVEQLQQQFLPVVRLFTGRQFLALLK